MSDLLEQGAAFLTAQLQLFASQPVKYQRGSGEIHDVTGSFGKTGVEVDGQSGFFVRSHITDFLVPVESFPSALELPQADDSITTKDGRKFIVKEIPGEGESRYSDAYRTQFRIHIEEVI